VSFRYTKAIDLVDDNAVFYCNRAAALPRAANTYLCVFETRYGG
jgi:hypothetical protein